MSLLLLFRPSAGGAPEEFVVLPFGPPSPSGGIGRGAPEARNAQGTPDADVYGPPSPEKVLV